MLCKIVTVKTLDGREVHLALLAMAGPNAGNYVTMVTIGMWHVVVGDRIAAELTADTQANLSPAYFRPYGVVISRDVIQEPSLFHVFSVLAVGVVVQDRLGLEHVWTERTFCFFFRFVTFLTLWSVRVVSFSRRIPKPIFFNFCQMFDVCMYSQGAHVGEQFSAESTFDAIF